MAILLLPVHATAEPRAWRNLTWGMTEPQVLAAFPGEAVVLKSPAVRRAIPATIALPRFTVGGVDIEAYFGFQDGRLALISLDATGGVTMSGYDVLERLLSEKYGAPLISQRSKDGAGASWRTPGALIRLWYSETTANMVVEYWPPNTVEKSL